MQEPEGIEFGEGTGCGAVERGGRCLFLCCERRGVVVIRNVCVTVKHVKWMMWGRFNDSVEISFEMTGRHWGIQKFSRQTG